MKRFKSEIKNFLLLTAIFVFVLFLDIVAVSLFYNHVVNFINKQPENIKADAGVLFFGDYIKDGKELGPNSKYRARQAAWLYKNGKVEKIICVGGYNQRYWKGKPHLMSEFLIKQGVSKNHIYYDSISFNTISNWDEAQKIIEENNFNSIIAISAPLHIYRISCMIDSDSVYYSSYRYRLEKFIDYWYLYKNVHREFISHFLNFVLRDNVRNKIVYTYRVIRMELKKIF